LRLDQRLPLKNKSTERDAIPPIHQHCGEDRLNIKQSLLLEH
jgi:hypothetical protein